MALISTKQLIDEYFSDKKKSFVAGARPMVDRPELYEYEQKIGKQLVEFTVDEAFELLSGFRYRKSNGTSVGMQPTTITQMISLYRDIVTYYSDEYVPVRNAFGNKRMKGVAATRAISKFNKPFTKEELFHIIDQLYETYDMPRSHYLVCILLLFYNGFYKTEEVVRLTKDMINFRSRQIYLQGRTITLSQQCFELLQFVHNLDEMPSTRANYVMASWNGGYFKFPVRQKDADSFSNRDIKKVRESISITIAKEINMVLKVNIEWFKLSEPGSLAINRLNNIQDASCRCEIKMDLLNCHDTMPVIL